MLNVNMICRILEIGRKMVNVVNEDRPQIRRLRQKSSAPSAGTADHRELVNKERILDIIHNFAIQVFLMFGFMRPMKL